MSLIRLPSALVVALVATLAACSSAPTATSPEPYTIASSQVTLEGTITAVDKATRDITLRGSEGDVFDFTAGEDVRNFDQLEVGDVVELDYKSAVAVEIQPAGTAEPGLSVQDNANRAATGSKPGGSVSGTVSVVSEIVAVDIAANTITLRGPEGNVVILDVVREDLRDGLRALKVGDLLRTTYTEAVALNIRPKAR